MEDEGGLVDLDLMPVEVEVEGLIVEVERPRVASEDADAEEDAHRTGMAHQETLTLLWLSLGVFDCLCS